MSQSQKPAQRPLSVVVAADQACAEMDLCRLLTDAGIKVSTFTRACEAARQVRSTEFDYLIVDCLLGSGTAHQIIEAARNFLGSPNTTTPIILLSRNFDVLLLKKYENANVEPILKPIPARDIVDKVLEHGQLLNLPKAA